MSAHERKTTQRTRVSESEQRGSPPRDADSLGAEPLVPDDVEGGRRPGSDREQRDQRQRTDDQQANEGLGGTRGMK